MATLIVNGSDLPKLSRRIVERLQRGTLGYEALMGWTGSSHQSVAKELHKLKAIGLVVADGTRPKTWGIVPGAVVPITVRTKAPQRAFAEWEDEKIMEWRAKGVSQTEIGRRLNRRRDSVKCRISVLTRRLLEQEAA